MGPTIKVMMNFSDHIYNNPYCIKQLLLLYCYSYWLNVSHQTSCYSHCCYILSIQCKLTQAIN